MSVVVISVEDIELKYLSQLRIDEVLRQSWEKCNINPKILLAKRLYVNSQDSLSIPPFHWYVVYDIIPTRSLTCVLSPPTKFLLDRAHAEIPKCLRSNYRDRKYEQLWLDEAGVEQFKFLAELCL